MIQRVEVIDSHTGGEPTRVVVSGGPAFGTGRVKEQLEVFRRDHDRFRSAVVNEPRGSDVLVGAILVPPADQGCVAGVIFFNNVGYLGMCGHGMIGLMVTLKHMGRIEAGEHRVETPVGIVIAVLHEDGRVSIRNVPSYRKASGVVVQVEGLGEVRGDVAWGGNWFFLVEGSRWSLDIAASDRLTEISWKTRQAINAQGFPEVDHIELFGPARTALANSRNFVLCPGKAYDRSPCGTGTSAKIACLAADGKLEPGEIWRQESITGSVFEASFQKVNGEIIPTITGTAHVNSEAKLILDPADPLCWGIASK